MMSTTGYTTLHFWCLILKELMVSRGTVMSVLVELITNGARLQQSTVF